MKIDPITHNVQISLNISRLDILMRKKQLQNIAKLIELDYEYSNIQDAFQLKTRNRFARELYDLHPNGDTVKERYEEFMELRSKCWT